MDFLLKDKPFLCFSTVPSDTLILDFQSPENCE